MRRLAIVAAFLLVVSLLPASAQRGGMRGGFGGRGGMAHAFGGHGSGPGHFGGLGFKFGGGRFDGFGFRGRGFHHHCWGCSFGFGFPWYAGYGYGSYPPFWWWDSSSSSNYDAEREHESLLANQMSLLSIKEQDLREREDWLRQREEEDSYARRPQARSDEHAAPSPEPATVLVFRDQHRQEITNYAISSGTLWVLNDHLLAKKIPLADLDLVATTKANDERGVEFQIPK